MATATLERLKWPATTTSFVLRRSIRVYARADDRSEPLGKIIGETRLPIGDSADGDERCKHWLAVAPAGWVCARHVEPSTLSPQAIAQPAVSKRRLLPRDYYGIKKGAPRFSTEDDVRDNIPMPEPKQRSSYMVTRHGTVVIDGETFVETSVGLVASSDLYEHRPSSFAGVDLVTSPPPAWPFAWVVAPGGGSAVVRATPDDKAAAAGSVTHREIVPVLEERGAFVRIGDGRWIHRASLRIARKRPRPAVDDAHSNWIDVDLDQQLMIVYEADTPVFATLLSSGRRKDDTPPGLYRLRSKSAITKMAAEEREFSHYEVSEVPWATRFRSGLYFHAAYWHDDFGNAVSHGCVNLSPIDARWVYDWTEPAMPPGWTEIEIALPGSIIVRVHDASQADPPAFDYAREGIGRVKIRRREKWLKKKREQRSLDQNIDARPL